MFSLVMNYSVLGVLAFVLKGCKYIELSMTMICEFGQMNVASKMLISVIELLVCVNELKVVDKNSFMQDVDSNICGLLVYLLLFNIDT